MMTVDQVEACLQRILIFFFPKADEQARYISAIHEQVAELCTVDEFDSACKIVAGRMRPKERPVPSDYIRAISEGRTARTRQTTGPCECNPPGLVYGEVWNETLQRRESAMVPCPKCKATGTPKKPTTDPNPEVQSRIDFKSRAAGE